MLKHLLERRDLLTCTRLARRLGMELELAHAPMFLRRMVSQKLFQLLEQMGDNAKATRPLILDALVSCGSDPDMRTVRPLCWGALAKLAARWKEECSDEQRERWEERAVLEELLSAHRRDEALEYAGDKPCLRSIVAQHVDAPAKAGGGGGGGGGGRGGGGGVRGLSDTALVGEEGGEQRGAEGESTSTCPGPFARLGPNEVEIIWVRSACEVRGCRAALEEVRMKEAAGVRGEGVVGLDCEWRHPRPVSLMQIALSDKVRV